jgi:hypothetical protein
MSATDIWDCQRAVSELGWRRLAEYTRKPRLIWEIEAACLSRAVAEVVVKLGRRARLAFALYR